MYKYRNRTSGQVVESEMPRVDLESLARWERLEPEGSASSTGAGQNLSFAWPGTHAELDEIAYDSGVEFTSKMKVADKIAALEEAGVEPPGEEE